MPWVPCQVVRGGQHRRTQLGLCCSRLITRHVCQLNGVASDVCAPLSAPSQAWQALKQRREPLHAPPPPVKEQTLHHASKRQ